MNIPNKSNKLNNWINSPLIKLQNYKITIKKVIKEIGIDCNKSKPKSYFTWKCIGTDNLISGRHIFIKAYNQRQNSPNTATSKHF